MEKVKATLIFMIISSMFTAYATPWLQEKKDIATIHVYVQVISSGPNATLVPVAAASITANSPTQFGQVLVLDDKLTVGPEFDSAEVGRLQGIVASSGIQVKAFSETLNFFFKAGKYNGSVVTLIGRNPFGQKQRELPVVGGTGALRFARGYGIGTLYPVQEEDREVVEYWIRITSAA